MPNLIQIFDRSANRGTKARDNRFRLGVYIGDLDAGDQRLFVGDVEGARPRWRVTVVHRGHVPELAAERVAGSHSAVDALPGDAVHTRDAVVSRAQWQGRRGCQQPAMAAR